MCLGVLMLVGMFVLVVVLVYVQDLVEMLCQEIWLLWQILDVMEKCLNVIELVLILVVFVVVIFLCVVFDVGMVVFLFVLIGGVMYVFGSGQVILLQCDLVVDLFSVVLCLDSVVGLMDFDLKGFFVVLGIDMLICIGGYVKLDVIVDVCVVGDQEQFVILFILVGSVYCDVFNFMLYVKQICFSFEVW